ncbi:flap structure-specific endonuclease [Purpureocillium lavendulum]|uniref:Flap structure-specific endonuclease n=1 Tax=Purpureocillium lavendulum TaxID=1247861 RepID=A0AB34FNP7_9HYPO|nr:flap structure-specific endonuclease [Purpureocillium lavendulum]
MGIKGIYRELGPGKRVSLSKLAADSIEHQNRPFRIAIDIAIWQFQTQAARGGTNPAIRTLFYRLVRLLGTPVQPVFVFDGPNKPVFKRNKRSGRGDGVATAQAKQLLRLFGFAIHDAPGEAEAECALLQKRGIVDAVLSEDVDTIMFGCTKTLRNWSSESKTAKTPTHVSLYDVQHPDIAKLGLDREGMVLIALMSGGDYLPDGIPGCGVKVAYEAAKAGFGKSICKLKASDSDGIQAWRQSLIHQLRTNEGGHFRTKHRALDIPEDFPNIEVLRYYTHPVVSPGSSLEAVRQKLGAKQIIHLDALREFTRETFDWDYKIGAIKFIRVLGQAMLVHNMSQGESCSRAWVKRISGRRQHFTTDATPELRLAYVPEEVVPIDLSKEVEETVSYGRDGLALNSDDDFEAAVDPDAAVDGSKAPKVFDVAKPDLTWVLESVARKSTPDAVKTWEDAMAVKLRKSPAKKTGTAPKPKKAATMPRGALDSFVRVTKPKPGRDETIRAAEVEPGAKASQKARLKIPPLPPSPPTKRHTYPQQGQRRFSSHQARPSHYLRYHHPHPLDRGLARYQMHSIPKSLVHPGKTKAKPKKAVSSKSYEETRYKQLSMDMDADKNVQHRKKQISV